MSSRTLLTSLFLVSTALSACASGDTLPDEEAPATTDSGGFNASGGMTSEGTGGSAGSGGFSSGGTLATGGTENPGESGGANTGGGSTGGASAGGSESGGANTGGAGSGGSDAEPEFNPCPTSGDACKILPFGDSITFGVGSTEGGGYRSRLFGLTLAAQEKITFTGSQSSGPAQVSGTSFPKNHEGRSGWTIDGITGLVPSPAFNTVPHIVLLMIGTNDITANRAQNVMMSQLDSLVSKITQAAPNALIVIAQITPIGWSPQNLATYNAAIPAFVDARAAQGQHIIRVDMSTMPKSGLDPKDNLHPNNQGYDFMATVWHDAIKEYLPH